MKVQKTPLERSFDQWLDDGRPRIAAVVGECWTSERLVAALTGSATRLPALYCAELELQPGATYGDAAALLMRLRAA